jgi:hypothetical protein
MSGLWRVQGEETWSDEFPIYGLGKYGRKGIYDRLKVAQWIYLY